MAQKILIFGATGQQGGALAQLCLADKGYEVFAATRNPDSAKSKALVDAGAKCVKADMMNPETLDAALAESKADAVFLVTDNGGKDETLQGTNVVDAVIRCGEQVKFLVFTSVADCDRVSPAVKHFITKLKIEEHMKKELPKTSTKFGILRPVYFLENGDNAQYAPLTKGSIKVMMDIKCKVKMVSVVDIGKAAKVFFENPEKYNGVTLDCASCEYSGVELAQILSEVSGVPCQAGPMMPKCVMACILKDLNAMCNYFEDEGYQSDIAKFKEIVPDTMDWRAFLMKKGEWTKPPGLKFTPA
jgi:uncharacterized protein YbjT (DUF2867 family)